MADPAEVNDSTEDQAEHWSTSVEDEGLKEALGNYDTQEKALDAIGYKAPEAPEPTDWREGIPEDLKQTAERFTSPEDAIRSIEEFRKRESQVRVPGKNATEEEVAAYRKAIGIPSDASEYEFPDLPEGYDMNEEIENSRKEWGKRFLDLNISKDAAKSLMDMVNKDAEALMQAQLKADEDYAKAQEDALRGEWKGDEYDKNVTYANRAFSELANRAGISVDELTKVETKEGRFLMDDARMLKLFSLVGREMAEGTLGPVLSESEMETAQEQLDEIRAEISKATAEGDSKKANRLYQKEQALIAKIHGDKPIVGDSRTV